jgi:hypothetical protein
MTCFTMTRIPILRYIVTEGGDSGIQQTHLVIRNVDVTSTRWVWTPLVVTLGEGERLSPRSSTRPISQAQSGRAPEHGIASW